MKKELSIIQLANIVNMVPQWLYKAISRPEEGKIYDPQAINYNELKKTLVKKFGSEEEVCELLEIENFDELVIERNRRSEITKLNYKNPDEMIIDEPVIVKSYHHEHNLILRDIREVNNDKLYIFEDLSVSKVSKDKYKVITEQEFTQARYRIVR